MTCNIFEIAAGTPFFHGTPRAVAVIRSGIKPSNATPAGKQMTGFRWFFASFSAALAHTVAAAGLPAVVEFNTTRPLRFADLRPVKAVWSGLGPEPDADEIQQHGLDGIVIGATGGLHDYEYGFVSTADLTYAGYELAPERWQIAEDGMELFWEQSQKQLDSWHEVQQLQRDELRAKIERGLAESE